MTPTFWIELAALVVTILLILSGQAILWNNFKTLVGAEMKVLKEKILEHRSKAEKQDKCIAHLKRELNLAITEPQHEKMQADCQTAIYKDISNIIRSMDDLRSEVRSGADKMQAIAVDIAGLRADLRHAGAIPEEKK